MLGDLLAGRVVAPPGPPHWHTQGRLVCWGPKIIEAHLTRRAARRAARAYQRGDR